MRQSPRARRLRSDFRAMEQLQAESTILDFSSSRPPHGGPPESYQIRFYGKGLWRDADSYEVLIRERHELRIELGASYPRMMPELTWKSPIFHPNISGSGVVCLGGYGTHWVPSLNLDELCSMLWDMVRYQNYDVESPYNREAAAWARSQTQFRLPVDHRPIRDRVAGEAPAKLRPPITSRPRPVDSNPEVLFLDEPLLEAEVIEAEIVEAELEGPDILFIE